MFIGKEFDLNELGVVAPDAAPAAVTALVTAPPQFEACRCGAETRLLRRDAAKGLRAYVVRCACGREGGTAYTTEQAAPALQRDAMQRAIDRWEP